MTSLAGLTLASSRPSEAILGHQLREGGPCRPEEPPFSPSSSSTARTPEVQAWGLWYGPGPRKGPHLRLPGGPPRAMPIADGSPICGQDRCGGLWPPEPSPVSTQTCASPGPQGAPQGRAPCSICWCWLLMANLLTCTGMGTTILGFLTGSPERLLTFPALMRFHLARRF